MPSTLESSPLGAVASSAPATIDVAIPPVSNSESVAVSTLPEAGQLEFTPSTGLPAVAEGATTASERALGIGALPATPDTLSPAISQSVATAESAPTTVINAADLSQAMVPDTAPGAAGQAIDQFAAAKIAEGADKNRQLEQAYTNVDQRLANQVALSPSEHARLAMQGFGQALKGRWQSGVVDYYKQNSGTVKFLSAAKRFMGKFFQAAEAAIDTFQNILTAQDNVSKQLFVKDGAVQWQKPEQGGTVAAEAPPAESAPAAEAVLKTPEAAPEKPALTGERIRATYQALQNTETRQALENLQALATDGGLSAAELREVLTVQLQDNPDIDVDVAMALMEDQDTMTRLGERLTACDKGIADGTLAVEAVDMALVKMFSPQARQRAKNNQRRQHSSSGGGYGGSVDKQTKEPEEAKEPAPASEGEEKAQAEKPKEEKSEPAKTEAVAEAPVTPETEGFRIKSEMGSNLPLAEQVKYLYADFQRLNDLSEGALSPSVRNETYEEKHEDGTVDTLQFSYAPEVIGKEAVSKAIEDRKIHCTVASALELAQRLDTKNPLIAFKRDLEATFGPGGVELNLLDESGNSTQFTSFEPGMNLRVKRSPDNRTVVVELQKGDADDARREPKLNTSLELTEAK